MLGRSVCLFHVNIPWGGLLSKCGDQASCKMCLNQIMTIKTRAETLVIKRLVQNEGSDLPLVLVEMAVATETSKPDPEQAQASPRHLKLRAEENWLQPRLSDKPGPARLPSR